MFEVSISYEALCINTLHRGQYSNRLRVYSKPGFAGESREFGTEVADCGGLIPMSFRVILGSWLLYDEKDYCGNQFVLGEGFYPDLTSCGCMTTAIKSLKPIPYSFSEPSISLFSLSSFEGLETVADSPMETMDNFFTQSLKVNSGLWVVYEFGQFRGCQMLLQMGEYPCWGEYSSWDTIGSLQPLRQVTNSRYLGTVSASLCVYVYVGAVVCKVGKGCLSVIGGKASVGARVALWEEHGRIHQRWRLNKNGTISPHLDFNLVLDRRGGSGIDKDHLILSELCTDKASQYWDIEVL
uniref:Beta/gamma crystallin 'Greek key' domain-containing protein n=1 Tax=Astyanax mexicanus TaxID=7994 RepID=A0A8B9JD23_ASTMX